MGLFKRNKSPAQLSARQLANTLHDAGMTDQQIADAIGASRSQVCKIRRGQETGTILRPRLLALVEGRVPRVNEPPRTASARPIRLVRQRPRAAPAVSATRDLVPQFDTSASDAVGLDASIDGRPFGWGGPDGRPTKQLPEPVHRDRVSHVQARTLRTARQSIDNRALVKQGYARLRDAGFSDAEAQSILAPFRELAQRQAAPQRAPDFEPFINQAEYELRHGNNAGYWTTADVIGRARELARQVASRRQMPRLPDPEVRLLAAPAPGPEPTPMFRDTQLAWPRQPARRSLGDSRAAMHEVTARQVSDSVTAALRQSTQQAPRPAEAPTIQKPPALGTPATLGAPVGLPDDVVR